MSMDKNGSICDEYTFENSQHNLFTAPSQKVEDSAVVDTCCAGDTFVGGFLFGYLNEKSIEESMAQGHMTASKIIQKIGCYFE